MGATGLILGVISTIWGPKETGSNHFQGVKHHLFFVLFILIFIIFRCDLCCGYQVSFYKGRHRALIRMTPRTVEGMRDIENGSVAGQANDSKLKVGSSTCD